MPHNQTVIDALFQVVSRHLPPPLQSVLDALMDRLQEQRIHAGSNKDEQTYIDFFRVCKHLREAVHLDTAAGICQRLRHSAPLSAAPTDLSEWNLVDDAEVEANRMIEDARSQAITIASSVTPPMARVPAVSIRL